MTHPRDERGEAARVFRDFLETLARLARACRPRPHKTATRPLVREVA